MNKPKILIIDDDKDLVHDLKTLLKGNYIIQGAYSGKDGLELLDSQTFNIILLDIEFESGMDGFQVLQELNQRDILIPIIMISKFSNINTVVRSMKLGAFDYVEKTSELSEMKLIIDGALQEFRLRKENEFFREEIQRMTGVLLGESETMKNIKNHISKLAATETTVLITGESGTGKELVARQIHQLSTRKDKPFVPVNCAAIPKELFESELFGHEKGAFTGAVKKKAGKFEIADKGTLFLDEIAELEKAAQAKLLRVLEDNNIVRVGGEENIVLDVRVIAATNKILPELVDQGLFRDDLYYRINVAPMQIPPLRERREDIPILTETFVKRKSEEMKKNIKTVAQNAMDALINYDWPGNVREMQNVIEHAVIFADSDILTQQSFPMLLSSSSSLLDYETAKKQALAKFQHKYVSTMLRLTEGNITRAAQKMGISRQGLQKMLKTLKINYTA